MRAFADACRPGTVSALRAVLHADVVAVCDGGGRVPAATEPVGGPEDVSALVAGLLCGQPDARPLPDCPPGPMDSSGPMLARRPSGWVERYWRSASERIMLPTVGAQPELRSMTEIGSRARTQPPPPHVVFEALTQPDRDPARPWLNARSDEVPPRILESTEPTLVVWSSIWRKLPDARIRFDLTPDGNGGTRLRWTLFAPAPIDDPALVGHLRKRMNLVINAHLRFTFGQ